MSHIIRIIASNAVLTANRSSCRIQQIVLPVSIRTIFSNAGIGIDNFNLAREQHVTRHAPSIDGFKKRFLESVNKPDIQIFTEDLRNMIMAADSDEEVDAVIEALRKYNSNKLKFTEYHFGSPIMRLLYIRNKPDLAVKLFMDDNLKGIFSDSGSALILLNKLVEDQRYDDAVKIFEYGSQRGFTTTSGRAYPTDVVMLTIEALYRQNTKQSLAKAKELLSKVMERDADINPRTASMVALLAVQQNEPSFAMEILGAVRAQNLTTIQNIRAICYAEMGRVEEAINVVHLLADKPPIDNDRRRVFSLTLQHIQKAVEKINDPDAKSRFEDLTKFISTNDCLSTKDLPDFLSEPITRRGATTPNRQGVSQGVRSGDNFRETGFRGGFNQRSGNVRPNTGNMDFNRDNRYQSDRRSPNSFNENNRFSNRNQQSSLNEYSRQQPSSRFNRTDSAVPRERDNEQNTSRRSGNKPGAMGTTSTSPIPQRSTRANEDTLQQTRRKTDDQSSSAGKLDERQTGGTTGIQQQSPWHQDGGRSS